MVGRYAYGDIYRATEQRPPGKGKVTISYQPEGGRPAQTLDVVGFGEGGGAAMAMHNTHKSIEGIASASFNDTRYNAAGRCDHGDAVGHAAERGFQMFGLRFGLGLGRGDVHLRVGGRQIGLVFGWACNRTLARSEPR